MALFTLAQLETPAACSAAVRDSPAVLWSPLLVRVTWYTHCLVDGECIELSRVLSPGTPSERERIENAGGWITAETDLVLARLHHMKLADPLAEKKLREKDYLRYVVPCLFRKSGCTLHPLIALLA